MTSASVAARQADAAPYLVAAIEPTPNKKNKPREGCTGNTRA